MVGLIVISHKCLFSLRWFYNFIFGGLQFYYKPSWREFMFILPAWDACLSSIPGHSHHTLFKHCFFPIFFLSTSLLWNFFF